MTTTSLILDEDTSSPIIKDVRSRIRMARATLPPPAPDFLRRVREILLIGSASRGGSSVLSEALRSSGCFLHLRGEFNPLLVMNGCSFPFSGTGSDALYAHSLGSSAKDDLEQDLAFECGRPSNQLGSEEALWRFTVDLASRLWMQWPLLAISLVEVRASLLGALKELTEEHGWKRGQFHDPRLFHVIFLKLLRNHHPGINPYFYDIDAKLVARHHPGTTPTSQPAADFLIEEPPFITISPWCVASAEDLNTGQALVIKTPSNAYRMDFVRALFPNARVRLLHLTRNVAASVNGLWDGWQYRGFHSHRVSARLHIHGYSSRPIARAQHWWKFDLPPGWEAYRHSRLEHVCLFQWMSAHRALRRSFDELGIDRRLRLKVEDIFGPTEHRQRAFDELTRWTGQPLSSGVMAAWTNLPLVMATSAPSERRWLLRSSLIRPLLRRPDVRQLMTELEYDCDRISEDER